MNRQEFLGYFYGIFIDFNGMLTINFIDLMGYQCDI